MRITKEKIKRKLTSRFKKKVEIGLISLEQVNNDNSAWSKAVSYFVKNKIREMDYFQTLEKDIHELKIKKSSEAYQVMKKILSFSTSTEEKIVAYKIMEKQELLEAEDVRNYMRIIRNMDDLNMAFCMNIDLHSYAFRHKETQYPEYYTDRRSTIKHIAEGMSDYKDCSMTNNDSKRIAVLARTVQSIRNSAVSFYVLDDAVELAKKGYEVTLFVSGYFFYRDEDSFIKPNFPQYDVSKEYSNEHREFTKGLIHIIYIDGKTIKERMNNCIGAIQRFNPSVIIDYSSQHAFETAILVKMYPVLYVSLSGVVSCDFFHKYMCQNEENCIAQNRIFHSVKEEQMYVYNKPIRNMLPEKSFNRKDYGFNKSDFILVTVGYRIKYELENDCIDAICSIIKKHKEIRWLIVTGEEHPYIKEKYGDLLDSKNVIMWGLEKDISGLYTICNAYVNPNRTGGGASICYAMHASLPILMNDYPSDAVAYVGKENLTKNYEEMSMKLENMAVNCEYYKQEREKSYSRAKKCSTAETVDQYLQAIKELKMEIEENR